MNEIKQLRLSLAHPASLNLIVRQQELFSGNAYPCESLDPCCGVGSIQRLRHDRTSLNS
jgi:hypothetical protein